MAQADESGDYVIFGDDDTADTNIRVTVRDIYEWLDSEENEECIDRIIIETLAEIKTWQYRRNPRIPLRQIVLNRNLYNRVAKFTDV
jgi:hypothetical protein